MAKTYQEKLDNIKAWVEITNLHWDRLEGEMFNDGQFWDETLHAMQNDDWWDWTDIAPALKIQYNEIWFKYPKLETATDEVKKLLMLGKPVTKKDRKGKNFEAFRLLMNIKDFINDINETPTPQYSKPKAKAQPTKIETETTPEYTRVTIWHNLFEVND